MGIAVLTNINRLIKVSATFEELNEDASDWPIVKVERPGQAPLYFDVAETKAMNHKKATAHAAALTLGGFSDWRLPELPELETIRELDRFEPACNTAFFPKCKSGAYWTATGVPWSSDLARSVSFYYGLSSWGRHGSELFVRAVRVGQ
jgi:hypothetical protein